MSEITHGLEYVVFMVGMALVGVGVFAGWMIWG